MDPACKREIEVEIPADVVAKHQEALVQQYSKQARIPGFRKGKVPASMVRNRFSSEITSDVVEHLVPQYFREAVVKGGFRPVSQPHIYGLEFTPGEPIKFKAAFEVLPEFDLGDYKAIKVEQPDVTITDEQIDHEIKLLQEKQASFDPVDEERGAENGEFVQVSFEARPKNLADDEPEAESARTRQRLKEKTQPPKVQTRKMTLLSRCRWKKCWSKSAGPIPSRNLPRTWRAPRRAKSAALKCLILKIFMTSGWPAWHLITK